jgi:hypothetical protein
MRQEPPKSWDNKMSRILEKKIWGFWENLGTNVYTMHNYKGTILWIYD